MIAVSCPGFSMTPVAEMLEAIAPHFRAWEIIAEGMHALPDIQDELKELKSSYDIELAVHAPFSDLNIASLNVRIKEEVLAQVSEAIGIASALDMKMVTLHPGHKSPLGAYFPGKLREVHRESLLNLDAVGQEHGMTLALENMPKMWISLCAHSQEMRECIEGTDLKICFDVGHANITGDIEGFFEMKDRIANLHVHDNHGDVDRHLVLGQGAIDIQGILKALAGYKGLYVIECMNLEEGMESKVVLERMLKDI
jgi:sugar phosphate isomerase/epimerase